MPKRPPLPCALTIAGSDSGGGAGIQADLKTFAEFGVHGLCAVTCLTAQNPDAVLGVHAIPPAFLRRQLDAVCSGFKPAAIKTGMLYSRGLIEIVFEFTRSYREAALVIDPVMVATSGAHLLNRSAMTALTRLLPLASVITPNVPEAEALTGTVIRTVEHQRRAARSLFEHYGCATVVKGGHATGSEAADIFFDGRDELLLTADRVKGVRTHGTGCTFAAALTACLALGHTAAEATIHAKEFISRAITASRPAGRYTVLGWKARQ